MSTNPPRTSRRKNAPKKEPAAKTLTKSKPKSSLKTEVQPTSNKDPINFTIDDILKVSDPQELVAIVTSLVNTAQDENFNAYKKKAQAQMDADHKLIQELTRNQFNNNQNNQVDASGPSSQSTPSTATFQSPIRRSRQTDIGQTQLTKELDNIGFTLDMLDLMTGVRVLNFQEDENRFYFDIKQSARVYHMTYRLVVSKKFKNTPEVEYVPSFLEALKDDFEPSPDESLPVEELKENARILKKNLPAYLCDNLTFPYNTLSRFYYRLYKELGGGTDDSGNEISDSYDSQK